MLDNYILISNDLWKQRRAVTDDIIIMLEEYGRVREAIWLAEKVTFIVDQTDLECFLGLRRAEVATIGAILDELYSQLNELDYLIAEKEGMYRDDRTEWE